MLFLEFTSKNSLLSMPVSLNQERGEIGTFYNRPTSQITEMAVSLFNILVNFTKYYLDNITKHYLYYLDSKYNFFNASDQFSSCNVIYLWNFLYFTLCF